MWILRYRRTKLFMNMDFTNWINKIVFVMRMSPFFQGVWNICISFEYNWKGEWDISTFLRPQSVDGIAIAEGELRLSVSLSLACLRTNRNDCHRKSCLLPHLKMLSIIWLYLLIFVMQECARSAGKANEKCMHGYISLRGCVNITIQMWY